MVGDGCATLKVTDDVGRCVALGGQVLLCHLGLHLLPGGADGVTDYLAYCVGLDNVVATVDFCEMLTIWAFADLEGNIVSIQSMNEFRKGREKKRLTWLPVENFFSVARTLPVRMAAFRADLPRTTASLGPVPPLVLLPILVTESQSSDILMDLVDVVDVDVDLAGFWVSWSGQRVCGFRFRRVVE